MEEVPDPVIEPTDAIVRITSTAICGSDLHLYELFGPYLDAGDILGHEPMGSSTRSAAGSRTLRRRRPRRGPVQHRVRHLLHVPAADCSRSARPPRCVSTAAARRCSATPSCTARCPAARPSTCACRCADYNPIKVGPRPAGRALPVPQRHPADGLAGGGVRRRAGRRHPGRDRARARSGSSPPASACIAATGASRWSRCRSAGRWRSGTASTTLRPHRHDRRRAARAHRRPRTGLPSSTRSAWRRTARRCVEARPDGGRTAARPGRASR